MPKFTGKRPHPQMQEEFMIEPATIKGKTDANRLMVRCGLKEMANEKVG